MKRHRRTYLKWLHWSLLPLVVWFTLVQPRDIRPLGDAAFMFHSVLGLIFVTLALLWTADHLRHGLASRPGPKLTGWMRRLHRAMHLTLIWGLFCVAVSGFLLGLTSTVLLWAGGIVPIAPPLGLPRANDLVGKIHAAEFYLLAGLVGGHAMFHLWRHVHLRDNALRIMVPRLFHKYL
ncbi:cytochrome B [Roseobacter sp. YSTF-M11]|uniref:Cytochrome B n=1 Tax=Roseobacter insulae TaxID=2859783 RepID=A0A9X1FTQ5_9RHOB|nr:cytochrome b/b6 domain-containing protein [Roseobacter insulae]MBW4707493.1 cytochrome B [Roseobacter insulae]